MPIVGLLVLLVVLFFLFWAVQQLGAAFDVPQPVRTVLLVFLVLIGLIMLLRLFGLEMGTVLHL